MHRALARLLALLGAVYACLTLQTTFALAAETGAHQGLWIGSLALCKGNVTSYDIAKGVGSDKFKLSVVLDAEAQRNFASLTHNLVGQPLVVVLDDAIIMEPIVHEPLTSGLVSIYWFSEAQIERVKSIVAGPC